MLLPFPAALVADEAKPWVAPAEARKMKNPVAVTGEGLSAAAPLYQENCVRCHGATGAADGPSAGSLASEPAKFTDAKMLKAATDGELFWKISNGRDPMPSYAQLPEADRWRLVNYVRDLARRSQYRFLGVRHAR